MQKDSSQPKAGKGSNCSPSVSGGEGKKLYKFTVALAEGKWAI